MKVSIKQVKKAYLDTNKYAQTTSNSGVVELTNFVKSLCIQYYTEIQKFEKNQEIYYFLQKKINETK